MNFRMPALALGLGFACATAGLPLAAQTGAAAQTNAAQTNAAAVAADTAALPLPAPGNSTLTGKIMQRLTDDTVLRGTTITVSVGDNGVVRLNGVVPTDALQTRAVDIVKAVPGVSSVVSQILVNQDPFAPAPPASTGPMPPINTAPPPPLAASEPQALIADALAKVPALSRVSGNLYGNRIMLIGTVTSDRDRKQAEAVARQTLPNYAISDLIWVDPHPLSPPPRVPNSGRG